MPVKVEERTDRTARQIVTAMIVSRTVLAAVAPKWDSQLFDSQWCNLVGGWCVRYWNRYGRPPVDDIEGMYDDWLAKKKRDPDTAQLVGRFLEGLSDEYARLKKSVNPQYVVDVAGEYFNKVRLRRMGEEIVDLIEAGEYEEAEKVRAAFDKVNVGGSSYTDPLADEEAMIDALNHKADVLIRYPDGAGRFFGDSLEREGFVSFIAPDKTGKSFWLMDMAVRAVEQGKRTAFFAVGDMTRRQMLRRFAARLCERPLKPQPVNYPTYLELEGDAPEVDFEVRDYPDAITTDEVLSQMRQDRVGDDLLRLSVHPNTSISAHGVRSILQEWGRKGWSVDCVIIDYADILAPINGSAETRDQINATWKALSALRQELHCLVITATQTNAEGYKADVLGKSNFSEDKRKLAHCTGMVGINVSKEDKAKGLFRLNWVVLREGEFAETKCVYTAGCLAVANPCILSRF